MRRLLLLTLVLLPACASSGLAPDDLPWSRAPEVPALSGTGPGLCQIRPANSSGTEPWSPPDPAHTGACKPPR